ncbi:hypothetical protein [Flavobacterium frigidarium]|uniref:hypothetical protein n=1 Tax=Flavobacterium frigidarium TaxID=99286 RepID=UPI0030D9D89D|tara:strand:- start:590 stop:1441 length:852 start_codon:yes stop_codon:yes gene_type:complete
MKNYRLATLFFGVLLIGCNQKENEKSTTVANGKLTDTIENVSNELDSGTNDTLKDSEVASIQVLIDLFKEKDVKQIANHISYPLKRQYPIPSINNKEEFIQRFSEVFDNVLIEKVANSKIEQWSEVGWRGIMFDNGSVWMANSDGNITAVTYQSATEKEMLTDLVKNQKEHLHSSLSNFKKPVYKIRTKKYLVRIDELANEKYRYASWKVTDKESSKPELIINGGKIAFSGSGGNHVITFANGNYVYKVYRNVIGTKDSADITLEIEQDGKTILSQNGTLISD